MNALRIGNPVALSVTEEDTGLVLLRELVRRAIDDSGWKHDAVAACMCEVDLP
jgi:hypothetical protein